MQRKEVEALACLEGVLLAPEWTRSKTIFKSDCTSVIQVVCRLGVDKSQLAFIVNDIKHVSRMLAEVRFQHVRREQNEIAHELAQLAKCTSHSAVWHVQVPQFVELLIAKDYIMFHE